MFLSDEVWKSGKSLFDNAIKALSFCQMGLMSGERRKSQCGLCHM